MELFIASVEDPGRAEGLAVVIRGRGAFRRFKDELVRWPGEVWARVGQLLRTRPVGVVPGMRQLVPFLIGQPVTNSVFSVGLPARSPSAGGAPASRR